MSAAIKAATKIQIGKESTRGTAVAATRRLTGAGQVKRELTQQHFEDLNFGVLSRTARAPIPVRHGFGFTYTAPLSFEEILLALMAGMKGGVTGSGAGADKTWPFTAPVAADPAPDAYTIEWVESDMSNNFEVGAQYCLVESFNIKGGLEQTPELTINFFGRKPVESTLTGSIALPSLTVVAGALFSVWVDDSWANLGTTQIAGQVYDFDFTFNTGLFPQYYHDGRTDLDFSTHHVRPHMADLKLSAVIDAASGGFVRDQQAIKVAGTTRYVQLRLTGGSLGSSNYSIKLNMAGTHADDSMQDRGADRDGNMVTTMHFQSVYDATAAKDVEAVVVNAATAFP